MKQNRWFAGLAAATLLLTTATACGSAPAADSATQNDSITSTKTTMKPIELTKAEFLQRVADIDASPAEWHYLGDRPALIDFYATWCGPCRMVAPVLEELAAEYGDSVYIYKIDTDKEQELAAAFGIRSIPSLLFVPMEGTPQMVQGAMGKADFKRLIDELLLGKKQ